MTQEAYELYDKAQSEQHTRNEARRIRTRVNEARRNPHPASFRWPFELLQNALDSGPRGGTAISIVIRRSLSKLTFEHDGAAFTSQELAALLSGGSSKEFESEITTGRFGTGFLVTHVLAEHATLRGLLKVSDGYERFQLVLDRSGDEESILKNINSCKETIRVATKISDLGGVPSASFEYSIDDDHTLLVGLNALRQALPYLYATRPSLGRVEFELEGNAEVWIPGHVVQEKYDATIVEHRSIRREQDGLVLPELHIYRFISDDEAAASSALVLIEQDKDRWRVRLPEQGAPRVYREYPLRGSGFVPINFLLDGKFEPDQERAALLMGEGDKTLLIDAFDTAVVAVKYAIGERWKDAHMLARAFISQSAFDSTNADERRWWTEQLAGFADQVGRLPIVECVSESLPAIADEGWTADFVIPRLLPDTRDDETTVERMWSLVAAATELVPPCKELAHDWSMIAGGWHDLGLDVNRITVSRLAEYARGDASHLRELCVEGDAADWLVKFLDVVGECWSRRTGIETTVLLGLMPNQHGRLLSPQGLSRDGGVPEELKDICEGMGYDVRADLLLRKIEENVILEQYQYLRATLEKALPSIITEDDVILRAVRHLEENLAEDEDCEEEEEFLQQGSLLLLDYLWRSRGARAVAVARKVPLIAKNRRVVKWSHDRVMMAPVCNWHVSARQFANAYPPLRVLSDCYAGNLAGSLPDIVPALVGFGMAIADPIATDAPAELKERRLGALSSVDVEGVVVSNEVFSQIALLQPEVLNRCQEGMDEARALLGLVLCHIAPHDLSWRATRVVKGRRSREDVEVRLSGALWLADLKYRAWVPFPGEDGKPVKMLASATTLKHLLEPAWLENNDAAVLLLTEFFGFDELELRLLGLAPDADKRGELRSKIAKLLETGGPDPNVYVSLVEQIEDDRRRGRDIAGCKRLGIAVQEAVKLAIEDYGLDVELIDHGFDYEVTAQTSMVIEDASTKLKIGSYLLEIKATTTGRPCLTPTQAKMASRELSRYALCVVDLRGLSEAALNDDWTADRVEPLVKVISDIGNRVEETCRLVQSATTNSVAIRNESVLRYEVPASVWESGQSISDWVVSISKVDQS
jgi:hypothetical protein